MAKINYHALSEALFKQPTNKDFIESDNIKLSSSITKQSILDIKYLRNFISKQCWLHNWLLFSPEKWSQSAMGEFYGDKNW